MEEVKRINPEHIKAVLELLRHGPYFRLLSMEISRIKPGYSQVEIDLSEKHLNPFGGLHGGVYASIIDTAAYWAAYCDLADDAGLITIDLHVDNLMAVREGRIVAAGKTIKMGRRICVCEATVTDLRGKLLAHGTSKQMVTQAAADQPGQQTISQAAFALGCGSLPPKFL